MIRARIGKIALGGIVVGASLSLWPATTGAQPECPYPHRDTEQWTINTYANDSAFHRRIDRNNNGVLCFKSSDRGVAVRDDLDPFFENLDSATDKVTITQVTRISCDGSTPPGARTVGFANIRSDGNGPVVARVSLKDALPNATYDFILLQLPGEAGACNKPAAGSVTTNGQGNGTASFSAVKLPGTTAAFVFAAGPQLLVSGQYVFGSK